MAIVLDAMGSDQYPAPELEAALIASHELKNEVILVGDQEVIAQGFAKLGQTPKNIQIVHAPGHVGMADKAAQSTRENPLNSMAVGMQLVKDGRAQAFVTAGNTGAAYFHAVTILRRLGGISRPALTTPIPTLKGRAIFLDTGANADCRPEFLVDFALLGSIYSSKVLGVENPSVALLSNGEEAGKGNQLVKEAFPLLENAGLHFVGNTEPKEIFNGDIDVVIADGFTGNVFIKTSEAVAKLITTVLRNEISASSRAKIGYLLAKPAFEGLKKLMDPSEIGAALLMGINGYVFIGHGRSDAKALVSAMRLADRSIEADLLGSIKQALEDRKNNPI